MTGGPKNSHNSSKPPSSDGYRKKPALKKLRQSSGKKQGGQLGHNGSGMKIERLSDETIQHYPPACVSCSHRGECQARIAEKRYEYDIVVHSKLVEHHQMECWRPMQDQAVLQGKFSEHIKATKQYGLNIAALFTDEEISADSSRYDAIVQVGIAGNPLPTQESGKRGRLKRGKIRALLDRLQGKKDQILRFAWNWAVPFSNNEGERALQKILCKRISTKSRIW